MKESAVSLVLSFYNQSSIASLVLESALSQEIAVPYEVVVCDDGSSDDLHDRVRQAASRGDDIRYIWQPDSGFRLSRSRNNGIRCAQAPLIVFADGDTWLSNSFLADHLAAHAQPRRLVCGLRSTLVDAPPTSAQQLRSRCEATLVEAVEEPEHRAQRKGYGSSRPWMACLGGNFSVRRCRELYFDEAFEGWGSEDRDLACRLFEDGFTPYLLPKPNAVQIRSEKADWRAMNPEQTVAFLRNKLYLRLKYPHGEMSGSLSLVRYCYFDEAYDVWRAARVRQQRSEDSILVEFASWDAKQTETF